MLKLIRRYWFIFITNVWPLLVKIGKSVFQDRRDNVINDAIDSMATRAESVSPFAIFLDWSAANPGTAMVGTTCAILTGFACVNFIQQKRLRATQLETIRSSQAAALRIDAPFIDDKFDRREDPSSPYVTTSGQAAPYSGGTVTYSPELAKTADPARRFDVIQVTVTNASDSMDAEEVFGELEFFDQAGKSLVVVRDARWAEGGYASKMDSIVALSFTRIPAGKRRLLDILLRFRTDEDCYAIKTDSHLALWKPYGLRLTHRLFRVVVTVRGRNTAPATRTFWIGNDPGFGLSVWDELRGVKYV